MGEETGVLSLTAKEQYMAESNKQMSKCRDDDTDNTHDMIIDQETVRSQNGHTSPLQTPHKATLIPRTKTNIHKKTACQLINIHQSIQLIKKK
mmetsp:Transcript_32957/g.50418  ORF Transcript_32957/g.50418 Transcript_32957/m.50418 type:complete len:93 (+) Transcript_32957:261-539(+)